MSDLNVTPIRSIETYEDGFSFERIEGRVSWVGDPKDQTDAQIRKGIHVQDVRLEDDSGNSVKIRIIKSSMHMSRDDKGQWFAVECSFEAGRAQGMLKSSWFHREKNETFHFIEVNSKARIFKLANQPPQNGQGQSPAAASPPAETTPQAPQQQQQAARPVPQYLPPEQQFPPGTRTVEQLAEEWLSVYQVIQPMAEAAGVPESQWGALTTHIRLDFRNQSPIFRRQIEQQNGPQNQAPASGQQQPTDESWKQVPADHSGALIYDLAHNELCLFIADIASYSGDDQTRLSQKNAAARTMKARNVTWAEVYDALSGVLKRRFAADTVDSVHDAYRTARKNESDDEFYKMIVVNQQDFVQEIEVVAAS